MADNAFEFECNDLFPIVGQGLVFRGQVLGGEASVGDRLTVSESKDSVSGTIKVIERDRKLTPSTVIGAEIGILLVKFSDARLNAVLAPRADLESYPHVDTYREMLGVSYPVRLVKAS